MRAVEFFQLVGGARRFVLHCQVDFHWLVLCQFFYSLFSRSSILITIFQFSNFFLPLSHCSLSLSFLALLSLSLCCGCIVSMGMEEDGYVLSSYIDHPQNLLSLRSEEGGKRCNSRRKMMGMHKLCFGSGSYVRFLAHHFSSDLVSGYKTLSFTLYSYRGHVINIHLFCQKKSTMFKVS